MSEIRSGEALTSPTQPHQRTPLRRTSELARRTPLRAVAQTIRLMSDRGESVAAISAALNVDQARVARVVASTAKRRARINAKSAKQRQVETVQRGVKELLIARDGKVCRLLGTTGHKLGPCGGDIEYQHLAKQSACGPDEVESGILLCHLHNRAVELEPDDARRLGLTASAKHGVTVADCWRRLHQHGLAERPPSPRRFSEDRGMPEMMCACGRRAFGEFCGACFGEASQW
jgi:hypothetical protein